MGPSGGIRGRCPGTRGTGTPGTTPRMTSSCLVECGTDGGIRRRGGGVRERAGPDVVPEGRAGEGVVVRGLVRRTPQRRVVLDHLDLDLPPGTVTVVVGANGSGKSTFARVVAVDRPDAGTVVRPVPRAAGRRAGPGTAAVLGAPLARARRCPSPAPGTSTPASTGPAALGPPTTRAAGSAQQGHAAEGVPGRRVRAGPVVAVIDELFTGLDPLGRGHRRAAARSG